jgi:error-prone DNA polymerase
MYIELHARSAFSFLEGSSLPEDLVAVCARLKMPAMALLDTDGVYGAPRFHLAAKKLGIKAHIGAEVTANLSMSRRTCLPLLVSSRAGYQNLCRLITKARFRTKNWKSTPTG